VAVDVRAVIDASDRGCVRRAWFRHAFVVKPIVDPVFPDVVPVYRDPQHPHRGIVICGEAQLTTDPDNTVLEVRDVPVDRESKARIRRAAFPTLERWASAVREVTQVSELFDLEDTP
jgi:hypothetical protein